MRSLWRIIKFSFQDLGRNFGLSAMTVFILVLMLLSVNVLWSVDILTKQAMKLVKNQINVSLYFASDAGDKDVGEIKKYLDSFPEVTGVTTLSKEQVLQSFKDRHRMSKEVLDALDELGSNPFGPTLIVSTREPEDYKKIFTALDVPEYDSLIEAKSFDRQEDKLDKFQNIITRIEKLGMGISIMFAIIAFLIIFNTVRVAIQTHKIEISIKRLVGASNWFIRGPYLVESVFFTILAIAITVGVVFLALRWLDPYLAVVFPDAFSLTNYYNSHILLLFGMQALAVLFLTTVSSALAMRRQLKV